MPATRILRTGAASDHYVTLDLTPLGRQEEWEDSPEGYPQDPPCSRWRLHDEYGHFESDPD